MPTPPSIFDVKARRVRRDRVARQGTGDVEAHVADAIIDRLDSVRRSFERALIVNVGRGDILQALKGRVATIDTTDCGNVFARLHGGMMCDEDRLAVAPGSYDLVIVPTGLDTVDDLPGALIAARRALRPEGLFLASLPAAPSLPTLRHLARVADAATGIAAARVHPQIEVRDGGDLLVRAGFVLPVADVETVRLSYASFDRLIADLRAAGGTNLMATRVPVGRAWLSAARAAFAAQSGADDGRTEEAVTLMTLTGWAPAAREGTPPPVRPSPEHPSFR